MITEQEFFTNHLPEIKKSAKSYDEAVKMANAFIKENSITSDDGRPLEILKDKNMDNLQEIVSNELDKRQPVAAAKPSQFKNFTQFAMAVKRAKMGQIDERLKAASNVNVEGVGADGGFLVIPEIIENVQIIAGFKPTVLPVFGVTVTSKDAVTFQVAKNPTWATTGGVVTYWGNENAQMTDSKQVFADVDIKVKKLYALVNASQELVEDAPRFEQHLQEFVPMALSASIDDAIVNGVGVDGPKGFLNSGSKITVTRNTATNIKKEDLTNLLGRVIYDDVSELVYFVSPTGFSKLLDAGLANYTAVAGGVGPLGLPINLYMSVLGIPVVVSKHMKALGTSGDIALVNKFGYKIVAKGTSPRFSVSDHLYFDYDLRSYKFVMRVGGNTLLDSALTLPDGSTTVSHVAVLS